MRYIIDSRYFDGTCLTSMSDDMHSDYGGETLEALREREKNPYLVAVSPVRMTLLVKRYTRALCKPFHEITEERYYELLECLPPARMQSDWFFVGEPYYRNLYALCFESDGRYFRAERPVRLSNVEIYRQIREHMEKVNLHPAIVKKASFVKYVNWYKKTVTYIPYYFEYGGKNIFPEEPRHSDGIRIWRPPGTERDGGIAEEPARKPLRILYFLLPKEGHLRVF